MAIIFPTKKMFNQRAGRGNPQISKQLKIWAALPVHIRLFQKFHNFVKSALSLVFFIIIFRNLAERMAQR